jgi:GDP-fucose transporter C1
MYERIKIPAMDLEIAKKLVPVVSVNIIGLVFNTLCLRDVEASFFQVMPLIIENSNSESDAFKLRLQEGSSYPSP